MSTPPTEKICVLPPAKGLIVSRRVIGIGVGTVLAMVGVGRAVALVNFLLMRRMREAAGLEVRRPARES